jgi:hypothetical protein
MTTAITPTVRLNVIKHLAGGKTPDMVSDITKLPRAAVVDIGSHHGYPDTDKLSWAADILKKKIDDELATIPAGQPIPDPSPAVRQVTTTAASGGPVQLTKPDEIRVLLNTAKAHPSKRIQTAANRVFDDLDKLRALIADDQAKHAERRKSEAIRAAAKAEVERLEQELRDAKAKLRGSTTTTKAEPSSAPASSGSSPDGRANTLDQVRADLADRLARLGVTSRDVRAWAASTGLDCPVTGMLPTRVLNAYEAAHQPAAAAS